MKKCFTMSIAVLAALCFLGNSATAQDNEQVLGFGLGIPYGVLGVNYEIGVNQYVAGTAGLGFAIEGLGWCVGGRLYYPIGEKSRVRVSGLYGITAIATSAGYEDTFDGFAFGPGIDWRYGEKWSFQADVLVVSTDIPEGYKDESGDVKIALGFARRW